MMWSVLRQQLTWRRLPQATARWMSAPIRSGTTEELREREPKKIALRFIVGDTPGALQNALKYFWKNNINLTRLESRPCKLSNEYEFLVDFDGKKGDTHVESLINDLKKECKEVGYMGSKKVPWFPRRPQDIDHFSQMTLDAGADLDADHPGFHDKEYRARRAAIAAAAASYKHGDPIPRVEYSPNEVKAWGVVFEKLVPLVKQHACKEYNDILPEMMEACRYRTDNIPQIEDISQFLKSKTGFSLRPVAGLLTPRDFFNGLAFRVFFSTQYIRHHSKPLYTPEPDVVHEVMGHAPMFANKEFADFSQCIGMASIGATDDQITQLARCYWYTVEFGLCKENGQRKAYGAGLLSSFGELEYSMSDEPEIREWDPFHAAEHDYPITTYQPAYYVAESFTDAKDKMLQFVDTLDRPFHLRYNQETQEMEIDRSIDVKP